MHLRRAAALIARPLNASVRRNMSVRRVISVTVAIAILVGCGGAAAWKEVCGCAPAFAALGRDLPDSKSIVSGSVTPVEVEMATRRVLNSRHLPVTLHALRSLGDTFNDYCVADALKVKCTWWLWYRNGRERGVELSGFVDSPSNEAAKEIPSGQLSARFVERDHE